MPNTDVLVDQDDANVFPLLGEPVESGLDSRSVSLAVDHKEVLLRVGTSGDMLLRCQRSLPDTNTSAVRVQTHADASKEQSRHRVLVYVSGRLVNRRGAAERHRARPRH